jgi:DNA-binding transcriptional MocR family regulator
LVELARRFGLLLIEDADLAEGAPTPLAALAPECAVYVSGLSKSVSTGPAVMTAIACRWLDDGTVTRLEAQKRADAEIRQSMARDVADMTVVGHPSSYFLWLPLPAEVRADQVAGALIAERISVAMAEPFATSAHVPHAIRLALGSVSLDTLRVAFAKVKQVIEVHIHL